MNRISLQTATAITGLTKRTLWRHIRAGRLRALGGEPGERTQVVLADVLRLAEPPFSGEHTNLILAADRGEPQAECDLALLLFSAQRPQEAVCWLERSAKQYYPEAMCWLGRCYLTGQGIDRDLDLGLMWLTHAAVKGHPIARAWVGFLQGEEGQRLLAAPEGPLLTQALDELEHQVLLAALSRDRTAQA
ncbi:sel1 repeat family protein [Caldichromatium japonicum]|uniref:Sel1 repeat family protein n=1 Tax=Caldichromatium japonicum TaxID=2699430 RepID=A0A6G7VCL8_9GAMM|nr:SEL1-like repeat protein [Caldichromatium japonicum]QIK37625.1 sel1 repeat family protein [Caldichromatium japonicum]